MQALPPPPPPVECVAPESAKGAAYVVLSGDPTQLEALLAERRPSWVVEAKATNKGVGFARLKGDLNLPYRDIGGLIFNAQRRQLSVSFFTRPPICGMEDL